MAGTGNCNTISGDSCRDTSCLIIKHDGNNKLGTTITSPCKKIEDQVVSISYVDDTDLMVDGEDDIEKCKKESMSMIIIVVLLVEK